MKKILIFGNTCTGKTTIATEIAKRTGTEMRCCGELVKELVGRRGYKLSDNIPNAIYEEIDGESRRVLLLKNGSGVIEGTYLDCVLHDIFDESSMLAVRLICNNDERARRFAIRRGRGDSMDLALARSSLEERDRSDQLCRTIVYRSDATSPAIPRYLTLDTGTLSVSACASAIIEATRRGQKEVAPTKGL